MTEPRSPTRLRYRGFILAVLACLAATNVAHAQSDPCVLVPDPQRTGDTVLRCGPSVTLKAAPGSIYHANQAGNRVTSVQLDSGALLIDFHATPRQRDFQALTPLAIAAVRGTRWAMEVVPERSSTLVLAGAVGVRRRIGTGAVTLRPGQGVDVTATGSLTVKRWAPERVRALLARFGR